ncbi:putative cystine transporter YijE [Acaryochloris thomasi RCC1774]|uniref:Putative cystine transporter YijE n=2 Tax=Acaryochloris TaxID=155977 RepID=A0A2W1J9G8_9CYAN|nr:putative cystine transporter YijE [Acaryochloris thomasi RCC1774]
MDFLLVLLASVFFCFQNVIVRVLFNEYTVAGVVQTGGFVTATLPNSFLLMAMRMLLVVPLMSALAPALHPTVWADLGGLCRPQQRRYLMRSLLGGASMYIYLALLYIAIGLIPTGIALTLFFVFPVFTALLSWRFFGDVPTSFRWGMMGLALLGSGLTIPQNGLATSGLGVGLAIASGLAYGLYTVIAQKSFDHIHPVTFTWISFAVTLILSGISLLFWSAPETAIEWGPLWIGGLLSAIATSGGHLLYNSGIRQVGATSASIIGSTNPALTVVLAWLMIQETLSFVQLAGVALVTLSVALLSQERRSSPRVK